MTGRRGRHPGRAGGFYLVVALAIVSASQVEDTAEPEVCSMRVGQRAGAAAENLLVQHSAQLWSGRGSNDARRAAQEASADEADGAAVHAGARDSDAGGGSAPHLGHGARRALSAAEDSPRGGPEKGGRVATGRREIAAAADLHRPSGLPGRLDRRIEEALLQIGRGGPRRPRQDLALSTLLLLSVGLVVVAIVVATTCAGVSIFRGRREARRGEPRPVATYQRQAHPWHREASKAEAEGARPERPRESRGRQWLANSPRPTLLAGSSPRLEAKVPEVEKLLCPRLVVPEGAELVCAIRDALTRERQEMSFSIVDMEGKALSDVLVDERGPQCGIHVRLLDGTPLAWVRTAALHERPAGALEICSPSGRVFCTVACAEPGAGASPEDLEWSYELREPSGRPLYAISGDFQEKALNVVSPSGQLICATERCALPFDDRPHFQTCVASGIDAGLIICGLLAVCKLEGDSGRPSGCFRPRDSGESCSSFARVLGQ